VAAASLPPRHAPPLAAAAAVGFLLLEGLRVWLPSVLFVVGDAGSTSALVMGGFALGCLATTAIAGELAGRTNPRWWWVGGGVVALVARLALTVDAGPTARATLATLVVVGAGTALTALAAGATDPQDVRSGLLLGVAASAGLAATLGTVDLVWRRGALATLASLGLVIGAGWAMAAASRRLVDAPRRPTTDDGTERDGAVGAVWPWLALGPALALVLVLIAPAGRIAVALGRGDGLVDAAAVGLVALLPLAALAARRRSGPTSRLFGLALVLVGTAGALDAAGPRAVASQAALAIGLGLVVGSLPGAVGAAGGARAGRSAGLALLAFGAIVFAYYAPYDLVLPVSSRGVLLAAAGAVATASAAGLRRSSASAEGPTTGTLRPLATVVVAASALAVLAAAPSLVRPGSGPADAGTGGATTTDGTITVVLANVRMGFDEEGRFRARDVAALIDELDADIVVLNELDRGWATTGGHDVGTILARATGMTLVFAPAADEVWGNAILTRLDVREVDVERLPRGIDAMARSRLTVVLTLADGRELAVIGTHLSHVDRRGDTRLPQAQAVAADAARMRERGLATVVAGDLNAAPGSPELLAFAELVASALSPGRATYPAGRPTEQIDHVLVSPDLVVVEAEVLEARLSDHRFVRVVLSFAIRGTEDGTDAAAG
jgi:endonuclease/exonuclease/phosphatase family metal-dependent hydrolase